MSSMPHHIAKQLHDELEIAGTIYKIQPPPGYRTSHASSTSVESSASNGRYRRGQFTQPVRPRKGMAKNPSSSEDSRKSSEEENTTSETKSIWEPRHTFEEAYRTLKEKGKSLLSGFPFYMLPQGCNLPTGTKIIGPTPHQFGIVKENLLGNKFVGPNLKFDHKHVLDLSFVDKIQFSVVQNKLVELPTFEEIRRQWWQIKPGYGFDYQKGRRIELDIVFEPPFKFLKKPKPAIVLPKDLIKAEQEWRDRYFETDLGFKLRPGPYYLNNPCPRRKSRYIPYLRERDSDDSSIDLAYDSSDTDITEYDTDGQPTNKIPKDVTIKGYNMNRLPAEIRTAIIWTWLCSLDQEITSNAYQMFYGRGSKVKFPAKDNSIAAVLARDGSLTKRPDESDDEDDIILFNRPVATKLKIYVQDPTWNYKSHSVTSLTSPIVRLRRTCCSDTNVMNCANVNSDTKLLPIPPALYKEYGLKNNSSSLSLIAWSHSESVLEEEEAGDLKPDAGKDQTVVEPKERIAAEEYKPPKVAGDKPDPLPVDEENNEQMAYLGERINKYLNKFDGAIETRPDRIDLMLANLPAPPPTPRPLRREPRPRTPIKHKENSQAYLAQQERARAMSRAHAARNTVHRPPLQARPPRPHHSSKGASSKLQPIAEEKQPTEKEMSRKKMLKSMFGVKKVPVRKVPRRFKTPPLVTNSDETVPVRDDDNNGILQYKGPPNSPAHSGTTLDLKFEKPTTSKKEPKATLKITTPYELKKPGTMITKKL